MKIRHLIILMCFSQAVCGQDADNKSEEKKKPSWSLGLPERESKPDVNTPSLTNQADKAVETVRPDFGFDESDLSGESFESGIGGFSAGEMANNIPEDSDSSEVEAETTVVTKDTTENNVEVISQRTVGERSDYTWQLIVSDVIKIPKTLFYSKKSIRLKVTINPQGEVVKVSSIRNAAPASVLFYVKEAMEKWRYDPPEAFGISDDISKVLSIPLELR